VPAACGEHKHAATWLDPDKGHNGSRTASGTVSVVGLPSLSGCSRYLLSGVLTARGAFFAGPFFDVTDLKLVQFVAGLKGCNEPSRLFSPA
jgi:hypothetical protein